MHFGSRTQIELAWRWCLKRCGYGNTIVVWLSTLALTLNLLCPQRSHASRWASQEIILGLEGADEIPTSRLTKALRADLKRRNLDVGTELTLLELRLTMGCSEGDLGCIARGGRTIDAQTLIFGEIVLDGDQYSLELERLDVEAAKIVARREFIIPARALHDDRIDAASASILSEMLGKSDGSRRIVLDDKGRLVRAQLLGGKLLNAESDLPAVAVNNLVSVAESNGTSQHLIEPDTANSDPSEDSRPSSLETSSTRFLKSARWPVLGFGISAGLGLLALGTGVGASLMIRRDGPLVRDLIRTAEISLEDDSVNPNNNVNPNTDSNLCTLARASQASNQTLITNPTMDKICSKAEVLQKMQIATFVVAGTMALSSAIFSYFWIKMNRKVANHRFAGKFTLGRVINDQRLVVGAAPLRGGLNGHLLLRF